MPEEEYKVQAVEIVHFPNSSKAPHLVVDTVDTNGINGPRITAEYTHYGVKKIGCDFSPIDTGPANTPDTKDVKPDHVVYFSETGVVAGKEGREVLEAAQALIRIASSSKNVEEAKLNEFAAPHANAIISACKAEGSRSK
jgi:hypothetical protein